MFGHSSNRRYLIASLSMLSCLFVHGGCWSQPPRPGNPPNSPFQDGTAKDGTRDEGSTQRSEFWTLLPQALKESNSSRRDFGQLLLHPTIQSEIGLGPDEAAEIISLNKKHFQQGRELQAALGDSKATQQEKLDKLKQCLKEQEAEFIDLLKAHSNFERLIQIDIQVYGVRAVAHSHVAKLIGLSPEKSAELRQLNAELRREQMDKMGVTIREIMRSPESNKKIREVMQQVDEKIASALKNKLNSQQLDALDKLKGPKFAIPKDLFDRRPFAGPENKNRNNHNNSKDCND